MERFLSLFSRIKTRLFTFLLAGGFKSFGNRSRVSPPFRFSNQRFMCVGDRVSIHRDCWFVAYKERDAKRDPELILGSDCSIGMGATISAAQLIEIGEHVLLGRNVYISDHRHAYEDITCPIESQGLGDIRPIRIGKHTWLGQNVVVLPGVIIGEHCVIGANSVVNASIPPFSIAVGVPARVIKRYDPIQKQWKRVDQIVNNR